MPQAIPAGSEVSACLPWEGCAPGVSGALHPTQERGSPLSPTPDPGGQESSLLPSWESWDLTPAPLSPCSALAQRRRGEASEHPPGPHPGHHLVHVTSNSVFPFPRVSPPPPSACDPGPGPASAGLVSTPPSPRAHLPPDAAGRTTAGRWGRRSSRPASSAWATTWRTTGRYAPPGPQRTVALTALLSLSLLLSVSLPSAIPPLAIVYHLTGSLAASSLPCVSLDTGPLTWSLGAASVRPAPRLCPVSPLCTWGGPSCLLWARPPLLSLGPGAEADRQHGLR